MNGEIKVDMYKSFYAVINRGDGNRCAWCDKLLSEIKKVNEHLTIEDTLAKVEEAFNGEELLYGNFVKLKKELVNA
jgi:hypothetical protein